MRVQDSKFHKVWKKEVQNGFTKLNLGDSKKKKDGGYDNCTWYGCTLVGDAKNVEVNEGDTVTILSGELFKNKVGEKEYTNLTIFSIEVTKRGDQPHNAPFEEYSDNFAHLEDQDLEIPF